MLYLDVQHGAYKELAGWTVSWINPHDPWVRTKTAAYLTKNRADKAAATKRALRMQSVMVKPLFSMEVENTHGSNPEKLHGDLG